MTSLGEEERQEAIRYEPVNPSNLTPTTCQDEKKFEFRLDQQINSGQKLVESAKQSAENVAEVWHQREVSWQKEVCSWMTT